MEHAQRSVREKLSTSCGEKVTVTCIAAPAAMVPSCARVRVRVRVRVRGRGRGRGRVRVGVRVRVRVRG